jgi:hypothetical protein
MFNIIVLQMFHYFNTLIDFPGTLGVLLGAPGDPYKRRRVVTGQKVP